MTTQYNAIQGPYDYIRTVSIALIERENVSDAIRPYIKDARVLELACGSGFYTYSFLEWGARSVTGVDISSVMIEEARRRRPVTSADSIPSSLPADNNPVGEKQRNDDPVRFILADCSKPTAYKGGPFDIVFGAWLLNYAPDRASLLEMFTNVSLNLKPGGHFISVTVPPTDDPRSSIDAECTARPRAEGGSGLLFYEILDNVKDGVFFRAHGNTPVGDFQFDCYHLTAKLYEECAREAGLLGKLEWAVTSVPEQYLQGDGIGGSSLKEVRSYRTVPNYGVLVVEKTFA